MRWQGRRMSTNVDDRRGRGMGGTMVRRGGPIGCGGLLLILALTYFLGGDPQQVVDMLEQAQPPVESRVPNVPPSAGGPPQDNLGQFASVVLASTEDTWNRIYPQAFGRAYREPTLVLFNDAVRSADESGMGSCRPWITSVGTESRSNSPLRS